MPSVGNCLTTWGTFNVLAITVHGAIPSPNSHPEGLSSVYSHESRKTSGNDEHNNVCPYHRLASRT